MPNHTIDRTQHQRNRQHLPSTALPAERPADAQPVMVMTTMPSRVV